jgi:methylated-DNA-[protein]-cysteine S-methyltransferase
VPTSPAASGSAVTGLLLLDEISSPLGRIAIAARGGRLCALEFGRARLSRALARRFAGAPVRRAANPFGLSAKIRSYLKGAVVAVDSIPVDPGGTAFQRRVWSALRRIPAGRTMTYGELARALGRAAASRAVGAANGQNPISIVVPCHRLVGGDASLTGYGGGLWRKAWLLRHEGARPRGASARRAGGPRTGTPRSSRATRAARRSSSPR